VKTVVVVEDDRSLARLAQLNLTAEGYDVIVCSEGDMALAILRQVTPDLVLLDLKLPTAASGWDVLAFLRQEQRLQPVPVVVLSAWAHVQDRAQAQAAGANEYLVKPFGVAELLACIRRLIAQNPVISHVAPVQCVSADAGACSEDKH
jgi:DNA-binding response OmpR family regulator